MLDVMLDCFQWVEGFVCVCARMHVRTPCSLTFYRVASSCSWGLQEAWGCHSVNSSLLCTYFMAPVEHHLTPSLADRWLSNELPFSESCAHFFKQSTMTGLYSSSAQLSSRTKSTNRTVRKGRLNRQGN